MASRQTGVRSLSMTAARMPSRRSPSLAAREVKRYSRAQRLLDARVAAGGADELERAGHRERGLAARGSSACRGPSRWPRAGRRAAARSAASKASSISSPQRGERRRGGGRREGGDRGGVAGRGERGDELGPAGLGDEVVGEAGEDGVARPHAVAGEAEVLAEAAGGAGEERGAADVGDEADRRIRAWRPACVSPTMRWLPWPATPTPPPMTKPCISATTGFG